jgi:hypothetical protein
MVDCSCLQACCLVVSAELAGDRMADKVSDGGINKRNANVSQKCYPAAVTMALWRGIAESEGRW